MALILLLSVGACSSEEIISEQSNVYTDAEITEIDAVIGKLQYEESRTAVTMGDFSNNFIKLVWAEKDTIGIYPTEGDQLSFPIVEGVGTNKCTFNGGGWALKTSTSYKAYSPFNRAYYYHDSDKLPVSMLGQKQIGNGNSDHLGKYDLQIAEGKTPETGKISFDFKHQVCFIRMDLTAPIAATWKSITLESDALFTTEATMNISSETPSLTAVSTDNRVTLDLEDVKTNTDEIITAYIVVLPVNLTGKTLNAILTDSENNSFKTTAVIANDYRNLKAGFARWIKADEFLSEIPYLTFSADDEQTFQMSKAISTLEYSVDNSEWTVLGTNKIYFGGNKGELRLRGKSSIGTATSTSVNNYATIFFENETKVSCNGDIRTLIDYENYTTTNTGNARFCYLFENCTNLISAPSLPATSLANQCYKFMFKGCTNLTSAPSLPATKLASECYGSMFRDCINLLKAPELPATNLAGWCYYYMFYGCTSLISVPTLPVMELAEYCYFSMFEGCTSLTSAPALPATSLTEYCYAYMFHGCTGLTSTPFLSASILVEGCYWHMFSNCSNLNKITMLATDISASYCLDSWVSGVASTGMFIKAGGMISLTKGESGIPNGWRVEDHGID